eukprot:722011-Prorocentrum_minimum.AAC.1
MDRLAQLVSPGVSSDSLLDGLRLLCERLRQLARFFSLRFRLPSEILHVAELLLDLFEQVVAFLALYLHVNQAVSE